MKKLFALLLAVIMVLSMAACTTDAPAPSDEPEDTTPVDTTPVDSQPVDSQPEADPTETEVKVMTHEEYMAAELDAEVVVETYVQATQSWRDNKITVYAQSPDGAYFIYNMTCSEADAANLVPGTKIRVTGYKTEWSGEIEIAEGATFEIIADDTWIAPVTDVTEYLGTDDLIKYQNEFVSFTGLTISKIEYKNGEPGDDIYVTVSYNNAEYSFCVERYLTGPETEVYTTVGTLAEGDVVNIEGFLYWYEGVNTHITSIALAAAAE